MPVCFGKKFDEVEESLYSILGDDASFIKIAKQIYDHFALKDLLRNNTYLSCAFVEIYEAHKRELKALKGLCKEIDSTHGLAGNSSLYKKIFKEREAVNYASFVGVDSNISKVSISDFNKAVIKELEPYSSVVESTQSYRQLKYLAEKNELLVTPAVASTSLIPHQLHENELNVILDNAGTRYPFLKEYKEKILKLFRFRVPYYFGPLNSLSPYSNAVRVKNEKVTPWNFDEVFDENQTRAKFMNSLTNNCSYLFGENVLPRDSIYYQKYVILNRLNGISINGTKIDQKTKEAVYDYLLNRKKTTVNGLAKFIKNNCAFNEVSISGLNEDDAFISDSYCLFKQFFGNDLSKHEYIEKAERIIFICAIYKDNIVDAFDAIKEEMGSKLTDDQKKLLKGKTFTGWGRLSKKLLAELRTVLDSGEAISILDVLENETLTFNQIIYKDAKYNFGKLIEEENAAFAGNKSEEDVAKEMIDSLPAKYRRSVVQSLRIVDEVSSLYGKKPKYIAVEVTREDDPKKKNKKTISRYDELHAFLAALAKDVKNQPIQSCQAKEVLQELDKRFKDNQLKLKGKHLYLYFKQNGFDLYTGKKINIDDVLNGTGYDIDHIVPKCLRYDDSLDNTVLVSRSSNENVKKNIYPVPSSIRCNKEIVALWDYLHRVGAMSDKKYNALKRATPISEEELADFVNSQLNVVSQANVSLRNILGVLYKDTKVIFSKAQYPACLRQEYKIGKLRELNDAHHAVDAYLNVVAGVTLHNEYTRDYIFNNHAEISDDASSNKTFNMEKRLLDVLKKKQLDEKVVKNAWRHDALITYRQQYVDAEFYKETIHRKGREALIPVHTNGPLGDQMKYGGYEELKTSYFLVGTVAGKKTKKVLFDVPVLYSKLYSNKDELKVAIIKDQLPKANPDDVHLDYEHPIQPNQKIIVDSLPYLLCSKGGAANLKLAYQLYLSEEQVNYLAFFAKNEERLKTIAECENDSFEFELNRKGSSPFVVSKRMNTEIMESLLEKADQPIFENCIIVQTAKRIENDFGQLTMYQQLIRIFDVIKLFGRNSRYSSFTPNIMLKSKASLLSDEIYLVNESVTGLQSHKRKL